MAPLHLYPSVCSPFNFTQIQSPRYISVWKSKSSVRPIIKCVTKSSEENHKKSNDDSIRRSGNYMPTIWSFESIQSLNSKYKGETYAVRVNELKEKVKMMLDEVKGPLAQLEQVDMLQRLGISHHFDHEIKLILKGIYMKNSTHRSWKNDNLYSTALKFRLLRQHGYNVHQDVFSELKDEEGHFKAHMGGDIIAMLSLYEATYHLVEGESILEEAMEFSAKHLEAHVIKHGSNNGDGGDTMHELVSHALELPLHWRVTRLEARWFIDVYEKTPNFIPLFLELAKLDFNVVQSSHQEELKHVYTWWEKSGLGEGELDFARDRLVENFLWTVGVECEPQFGQYRIIAAEVNILITIIDDIYDVYGTLNELELFTNVIERWDMNGLEQLPNYMKTCLLALNSLIDKMSKEQSIHTIEPLKKSWKDLCKSYLVEAKWYHCKYTPTLKEYIENAWVSISAPVILVHAYLFVTHPLKSEALEFLEEYYEIIRYSATIFRFANDLGTSSDELKRGDTFKSIQCYMSEVGVSEDVARKHIKVLIYKTWKLINKLSLGDLLKSQ